jgi:hypothetical protein
MIKSSLMLVRRHIIMLKIILSEENLNSASLFGRNRIDAFRVNLVSHLS